MSKTNPNGSNQYFLDPRQKECWKLYIDPRSKTFGNATQSAIKAGYSEKSAQQIVASNWFIEKRRHAERITKSEKVLDEILEMNTKISKPVLLGKMVDYVEIEDPQLIKLKQDTAKFYLERIAKSKYTTRQEITGKGGSALIPSDEAKKKAANAINEFINDNKKDTTRQ